MYVELLSKHYGINASVSGMAINWWLLTIELDGAKPSKEGPLLDDSILNKFEDLYIDLANGSGHVEAEVISNGGGSSFEVTDLVALFEGISKSKRRKKPK
jgi:hypothetical protein